MKECPLISVTRQCFLLPCVMTFMPYEQGQYNSHDSTESRPLGEWATLDISPPLPIQLYDCFPSTCLKPKLQGWWAWHGDQDGGCFRTTPAPTQHEGITPLVRRVTESKQLKQTHLVTFSHATFYSETPDWKMGCDMFSTWGFPVYKQFKPTQ